MFGLGAMVASKKVDSQEIAKTDDSPNLIAEPFIDSLARIQQEKKLEKQAQKIYTKLLRDKRLAATYLKSKFPDAFDKFTMAVPEKELSRLLTLARRKYIARIVVGTVLLPTGITGLSLLTKFAPDPFPIGIPILLLSFAAFIFGALLAAMSGKILIDGE